jgi:hypothetical protein
MNLRKVWLLVTAALFVAWMTYLIVLAATHRHTATHYHTAVLSRPQFLVSQLDVIAHFDSADELQSDPITVKDVRYTIPALEKVDLIKDPLPVVNLASCSESWDGPGDYILPLEQVQHGKYRVVPVPLPNGHEPRIYRLTPETDAQLKYLPKAP